MEISINDINTYQLPLNCFQSHYKIIEYLGEGSFGKVFKAREISTGKIIAVKKMSVNNSEKKYSNIIKEINLLKHLDHPNIVKYYDYFKEEDYIYLMMEYLEGGTLKEYIKNKKEDITENEARIIIKQLLTAISYLHYTCDICHRDIKPENMMFANKNEITELKLLDFGLSSDSFESKKYLDNCGTLIYMAPEQINKMIYSKAVDVWSVGIILYMLLNKGKNPFYNKGENQEKIIKNISNNNITYSNDCPISHMARHLINKLLKKNPFHRYTIRSAMEHPWITMNKFDKIPMTIYDKAFIDEYVEKLKTLCLSAIFFAYQKKFNLTISKNNKNTIKNNKIKKKSNSTNDYFLSENKIKKNLPKRKISESCIKNFNMNEYEKMIKDSNLIYKQKFEEDREIMFNPKLTINNNNELLLSTLMKKINEKQKTRQCSFLFETKTNINYKDNTKYESLNSMNNLYIRQKKFKINKNKNNDEQKNNENDYEQIRQNNSKIKTPFKLKNNNNNLLDNNNKNEIPEYKHRNKLIRRFSAMPKICQKNINNNRNHEENKMKSFYRGSKTNERKLKNKNSYIKNYIDCSKKENDKNNKIDKNDKNDKNDYNILFKKQLEYKKKKFKTKSVKNTNVYFLDKSTLFDNKDKKWKMNYNNKDKSKDFLLMKKKEIIEKSLFDANLFINNEIKEHCFLNNDKKNKLLSFTEQSQKINPKKLFNKKFPKIFYNKKKINNIDSQI